MTLTQAALLLQFIDAGIDSALRLQAIYSKISKMSDEECQAFIGDEHKKTDLLMAIVDSL